MSRPRLLTEKFITYCSALFYNVSYNFGNMGLCKSEFVEQLKSRTAVSKPVGYTNFCYLDGILLAYNLANCVAETAFEGEVKV